jgi:uncharacterized protein (DUF1684 family)
VAVTFRSSCFAAGLCALIAGVGCTSGPGPVDDKPYDEQMLAARAQKDVFFRTDRDSPIPEENRAAFTGLAYYPIDPAYRVPASLSVDRTPTPVIIELETSQSRRDRYRRVGTLAFTVDGVLQHLTAFADVNAATMNRLFVPFGDETNNTETYGGGRFIELDRTPTGLYDLDFNRAYHPYCVYNHTWECPVPPRENRLAIEIRAGERLAK